MNGKIRVLVLRYKSFKERISITKKYEKDYKIENLGQFLYMVRR